MAPPREAAQWFRDRVFLRGTREFAALSMIAEASPRRRRKWLRPHEEAGILLNEIAELPGGRRWSVLELREKLDAALDRLVQIETGYQLGILSSTYDLHPDIQSCLLRLVRDEAFLQYLDVYDFFGVRFLCARQALLRDEVNRSISEHRGGTSGIQEDGDAADELWPNLPDLLLAMPPALQEQPPRLMEWLRSWEQLSEGQSVQKALLFLDGFWGERAGYEGEPQKGGYSQAQRTFELWLRGLLPEMDGLPMPTSADRNKFPPDKDQLSPELEEFLFIQSSPTEISGGQYFEEVRRGLEAWARNRAEMYSDVAKWRHEMTTGRPAVWQGLFDATRARRHGDAGADVPFNARLALMDFYYLARILRTDVTPSGAIISHDVSWLGLMAARATRLCDAKTAGELRVVESLLRAAYSAACELIQNAAELRSKELRLLLGEQENCSPAAKRWRQVFDDELKTIARQRKLRTYGAPPKGTLTAAHAGWSRSVVEGITARNLIGLALSGGGIRSATFGLGVLQGLQELDLLRKADYLSTVSGGGFVGGWLLGNVRRTQYWLGSHTCWDESIRHLRTYSNYLTPRSGLLSMDVWSMAVSWLRNTLLMQLSFFATLLAAFSWVYLCRHAFVAAANEARIVAFNLGTPLDLSQLSLLLLVTLVMCMLMFSLAPPYPGQSLKPEVDRWRRNCALGLFRASFLTVMLTLWSFAWRFRDMQTELRILWWPLLLALAAACVWLASTVAKSEKLRTQYGGTAAARWLAVVPGWIASALLAARIFGKVTTNAGAPSKLVATSQAYSHMLVWGLQQWPLTLGLSAVGFAFLARATLLSAYRWGDRRTSMATSVRRWWGPVACGVLCTVVIHLCFSAIAWGIANSCAPSGAFSAHQPRLEVVMFTIEPGLVMLSYALAILLIIGLCGKFSDEPEREWWTRFGGWTMAFSLVGLLLPAIVFGGPALVSFATLHGHSKPIAWTAVISWMASNVGSLFAGKSSRASDESPNRSELLQWIAKLGGLIFVLGVAMLTAQVLFSFFRVWVPVHKDSDEALLGISTVAYAVSPGIIFASFLVLCLCAWLFTWAFELNVFGFSQFYRNRLVRCYLGATRWRPGLRHPDPFTQFDFKDDIRLVDLGSQSRASAAEFRGPYPLLNCTLNLAGSHDLELHTRHSASFLLSPEYCGSSQTAVNYRRTEDFAGGQVRLGQAIAVSGAAASPNMGYNTSPLVAFMLTMFNVRLGWWFPNPGRDATGNIAIPNSLPYLLNELVGEANERRKFLNVSDGGHFENMGIYELVRRGCKLIILSDAECDEDMAFGGLANAIRLCATDFGAKIDLDLSSIRPKDGRASLVHAALGTIRYNNGVSGRIIYLKSSLTGDEDVTITQYKASHPTFPHETTANQFFTEDQFESYRRLGLHVVKKTFAGIGEDEHPLDAADRMADTLAPATCSPEIYLRHAAKLEDIWTKVRATGGGQGTLLRQLLGTSGPYAVVALTDELSLMGLEIFQFMETVYLDLRLDDFWEHPDNRGWAMLFMEWGRSPALRTVWKQQHRTFGIRFEYFCERRLGLFSDRPVVRVSPLPV